MTLDVASCIARRPLPQSIESPNRSEALSDGFLVVASFRCAVVNWELRMSGIAIPRSQHDRCSACRRCR